jgi:hypothetical protein
VTAGAQVISMSIGNSGYSQTLQSAINSAWQHNVVVVAAAGNSSTNTLFYPAGLNYSVGVSASDINNNLASFSNYGNDVTVGAPGVSVLSTFPTYSVTLGCCNYGSLSGTSMSTPFASALAGLLATSTPNTSGAAIVQRLQQGAVSPSGVDWGQDFGYGIINAYNAIAGVNRATSTGGVVGQIVNRFGSPVASAQVTVGTQTATTDSYGLYWIRPMPAGDYSVTVAATGYTTQSLTTTVAPGADTLLTVNMSATYGSFSGTVTDQGTPVAGAIVEALSGGLIAGIAVTDTNGSYTLWVPGGPGYTVQASQIWRTTTSVTSQSVAAGSSTTVNLTLPSMLGTIAGVVTDSNSNPIAGAQISASSSIYSATATTNGSGNYSIPRLFLGTYSVTASASGYPSSTTNGVSTSADTTTTVNFQLTATGESQTITFGALSNQAFGTAPFTVSATASSGLSVSFNSQTTAVCTVSGTTVTLVSVGTCTIQATQAGNSTWAPATPVNQSFQVTQGTQAITFGALANAAMGTTPTVSASASSGLAVSFNSQTTPVCTVSGSTVTLVSVGTCTIQATQAGNSNWAAATPVNQSFQVTQGSQTITFGALSNEPFGTAAFPVSATATSRLAVSFNSQTTSMCTVSGSTVTLVSVGTCTIQATQAGNTNWAAATPVNQSFLVTQGSQTITFGALSNAAMGTAPTVSATASSGLTVSFNSQTTAVCTVQGSTVTLVSVGTCTIQATQAGNTNWTAATPVNQSFQVTQGSQTITFGALSNEPFGTAAFPVSATATSGLAVSFNSQTTPVCTVSGSTVTLVAVGTCTIQATQAGNGNWAVATPVNQSFQVTQGSQTITFGALSNAAMGTAPTVSATASSGLSVSFNSQTTAVCTVQGSTVTLVSVGTCTIQATQAGNINWAAATPVNQSFQVTQGSQTITFGALSNEPFGTAAFPVSATATSGLAVSFNSQTTPVCTLSGSTVTLVSVGTCTIQATQAGNTTWAAATPVNQSFQVTQGSQTIIFGALSNAAMGTAPTVSATASSGLSVSFNSQTTAVCTVSSSTVTLVSVGTCTIQATQAGNSNWAAATPVNQSFQVTQGSQTITFGALPNEPFGTAAFPVSATATSGLAVSFNSQTAPVCTVSGSTVTLVSVGTCTIQATQSGNSNWAPATPVNQSFQVTQGSQTITFGALSNAAMGTAPTVSGSASSGLSVSFNSQTTALCTVSGTTVTLVAVGTCTIQATQAGNSNWAAATPVNQSFQVTQGSQTITFGALSNEAFGTAPFGVNATASSGLAVSFNSQTTAVCTVSGSTVTLVSVGTCTIQATQAGNGNWAAATPVNQSFQVTQGSQTITFGALSNEAFGSSPFTVSASASSGLAVSFNSQTTAVCTVSGSTVTLVSVGTCTIQATQAGNSNWAAATPVNQSFQVTQGSQTITLGALSNEPFGTAAFPVSATATSGLAVSFNSQTTPVCTVSGSTVTLVSVGTCTIQATQAGNSNWAAATPVNQSFQVTQGSQTITFGALSSEAFGTAPFAVSATASSGLSASFNSQTTAVCTVSGSTVTLVAVGTCTIQATQAGNGNWAAATPVNQSFQVTQGNQTITFGALSNVAFGSAPFTVSATASSGLVVSFSSQTTGICTVSGSTVTLVSGGTCTIQATQAGNSNWAAATPVNQSFQVTQGSQTITFGAITNEAFGSAPFTANATASSGLAVSFNSQTTSICTVSGSTVTLVAVGTCTIQATQAGNSNWAAATPVNQSFQVTQASQTITFGALSNEAFGSAAFNVSATASSGLAVSFTSQTTSICTVSGSTVTLVAVGTCTIQATQAGNGNWAAATLVNQSFQVTQGSLAPTWPNGYTYQATFTVASGQVSGTLINFPALINQPIGDWATVANGGKVQNTCTQSGAVPMTIPADLIFTSDAAGATLLPGWEFESYAAASGSSIVWLNVPSMAVGTVVYAWYGNSSVTACQATPSGTWNSNYLRVWHLANGSTLNVSDSTSNAGNATDDNATATTGQIDGAADFNGTNAYLQLANEGLGSLVGTGSFTLSFWAQASDTFANTKMFQDGAANGSNPSVRADWANPTTVRATVYTSGITNNLSATATGTNMNYFAVTYASATGAVDLYVNAGTPATATNTGTMANGASLVAGRAGGLSSAYFPGTIDEIRINKTALSAAWVTAEYNNQSAPTSFWTALTGGLNGAGAPPAVTLSAASISFANQVVNTSSGAQTFTITNTGGSALTIGSIAMTGANQADFAQTNNCPISPNTIAANGTCTVSVTFTPQGTSPFTAAVTITDNTANSPQSVSLSGTGVTPPAVTLSAASISFANQVVNTSSGAQTFTITNTGGSALTISSIAVTGANQADFAQTNNCPISPNTIAENGACTVSVSFTPQGTSAFAAAVTITDNAANSPQSVSLSGAGVAPGTAWPNGYTYQATFTVASGRVSGTLTNFPALINQPIGDWATVGNGGKIQNTCMQSGAVQMTIPADLIFTSDAAGATLLPGWEFESYAAASGSSIVWLNVPSMAAGTVVYAWYGNSSVTSCQGTPSGTWNSNYLRVWHLANGSTLNVSDSTSNAGNATNDNATATTGQIDGAADFNGTNAYLQLANEGLGSLVGNGSFTLSFWAQASGTFANTKMFQDGAANGSNPSVRADWANPTTVRATVYTSGITNNLSATATGTNMNYFAVTYASGTGAVDLYVNAGTPATATNTGSMANGASLVAGRSGGLSSAYFPGTIDEIRINRTALSAAWIAAEYNNQSAPTSFWTVVTSTVP